MLHTGLNALFLLTRPLRDVTLFALPATADKIFLLTRPLRDVTVSPSSCAIRLIISTHTPLAGRDLTRGSTHTIAGRFLLTRPLRDVTIIDVPARKASSISTHTPLAGRDKAV